MYFASQYPSSVVAPDTKIVDAAPALYSCTAVSNRSRNTVDGVPSASTLAPGTTMAPTVGSVWDWAEVAVASGFVVALAFAMVSAFVCAFVLAEMAVLLTTRSFVVNQTNAFIPASASTATKNIASKNFASLPTKRKGVVIMLDTFGMRCTLSFLREIS